MPPPFNPRKESGMKARPSVIAGLLLAAGASAAIAVAPAALADPTEPNCQVVEPGADVPEGAGELPACNTPGNVNETDTPQYYSDYGPYPWDDGYWVL